MTNGPTEFKFQFPEDRAFFDKLLGAVGGFERNKLLFDSRALSQKRAEFNRGRRKPLGKCELQYAEPEYPVNCSGEAEQTDHIIPLVSNRLNKAIREIERIGKKKVPPQSFGSNHPSNLASVCRKCNGHKESRLSGVGIAEVLARRLKAEASGESQGLTGPTRDPRSR